MIATRWPIIPGLAATWSQLPRSHPTPVHRVDLALRRHIMNPEARETTLPSEGGSSPVAPLPSGVAERSAAPSYPPLRSGDLHTRQRRRILPLALFVITCFSTFLAGATDWMPMLYLMGNGLELRRMLLLNWQQGLVYMGALLGILLFHEMGHFLMTVRYRIPASFPFFIPLPISPIGTMGAVIGMAGHRADRKQMFDIGIAGPLAGLVVAIPLLWLGLGQLDITRGQTGAYKLDCPWIVELLLPYVRPDIPRLDYIWIGQANAFLMAAWVGLLITGLNMMPVSQLDGGHVIYTLLLKKGHWVARAFLFTAIVYVTFFKAGMWSVMIIIVILMGTDHPPTSNDHMPLGWFRTVLGYASLLIPIFCFPAEAIVPI